MREREEKNPKYFAPKTGQEDSLNITIFDSRCQNCQVIHENIRCNQKEHVCVLNGTCVEQGSIHPGDICQHCIEGRWRPKSGKVHIFEKATNFCKIFTLLLTGTI